MGILRKALGIARYSAVPVVLPPEQWFVQAGYFQFGMPWPWEQSPDTSPVIDLTAGEHLESYGYAFAPRTDGMARMALWREPGTIDDPNLGNRVAINHGARLLRTSAVSLGGIRAVVVSVEGQQQRTHMVYADRSGYLVAGQFDAPRSAADGYEPHLATMLGTWEWFA